MKCRLVYVSWLLEKKRNKGKGVKREWRIKENDQHQFSTTKMNSPKKQGKVKLRKLVILKKK